MMATTMTNREHFHSARLVGTISRFAYRTQHRLPEATAHFASRDRTLDRGLASGLLVGSPGAAGVVRDGVNDCFYWIGMALSAVVIPFFRRAKISGGVEVH